MFKVQSNRVEYNGYDNGRKRDRKYGTKAASEFREWRVWDNVEAKVQLKIRDKRI